jgi:NADH dehydrogenase
VFVIGDTAHVVAPSRNLLGIKAKDPMMLPGVAQPAIQEGRYVARIIRRRVLGLKPPPPFWYWEKGDLAIVGRSYAVADLRFVRFAGFIGWLLWALVHIYFLIGFANRFFVLSQWAFAFFTKRRRFASSRAMSAKGREQCCHTEASTQKMLLHLRGH